MRKYDVTKTIPKKSPSSVSISITGTLVSEFTTGCTELKEERFLGSGLFQFNFPSLANPRLHFLPKDLGVSRCKRML